MQIKTFEIEEVQGELGNMAADSEAMEICTKLGLEGQLGLTNTDTATRFPYPRMSSLQTLVFSLALPEKTKLQDFKHGIIPLRVLQAAAFCKGFPQSQYLEIWHTAVPKEDPILVGRKDSYSSENFLIAQWGDVLVPFEQMVEQAKKVWMADRAAHLAELKGKIDSWTRDLALLADKAFTTGKDFNPRIWD